jgi:hypothetical protein
MVSLNKDTIEWFIVGSIITLGLLPVRLLFIELVSDKWIGSFGIVSIIMIVVVVLSEKNRLGSFGRIFLRQMLKTHQGKRRLVTYSIIVITLSYLSMSVILIESGNGLFPEYKDRAVSSLESKGITGLETVHNMTPQYEKISVDVSNDNLKPFIALAVTHAVINDWSSGLMLHLHTVLLVEELEIIGLLTYYGIRSRRNEVIKN